jgi:transposase
LRLKYTVALTAEDRLALGQLIASGVAPARVVTHARILLKADEGPEGPRWTNAAILEALDVHETTISRVRKRFAEEGLEAALYRREQKKRKAPRLDGRQEAYLLALACSPAPAGQGRWSLRLLADQMVELGYVESVSHETVRQTLKRGRSSRT